MDVGLRFNVLLSEIQIHIEDPPGFDDLISIELILILLYNISEMGAQPFWGFHFDSNVLSIAFEYVLAGGEVVGEVDGY